MVGTEKKERCHVQTMVARRIGGLHLWLEFHRSVCCCDEDGCGASEVSWFRRDRELPILSGEVFSSVVIPKGCCHPPEGRGFGF